MFHWTFWIAYWIGRILDIIIIGCFLVLAVVMVNLFVWKATKWRSFWNRLKGGKHGQTA